MIKAYNQRILSLIITCKTSKYLLLWEKNLYKNLFQVKLYNIKLIIYSTGKAKKYKNIMPA
ncbi:hypothetical protein RMAECT_0006 [Rickettsia rhipicephali str. Ect]|uniref:Uncharacterized protein n=1 Tax=Rickettsia rhipicephali str. Ect TaxID=1359199 RepID=A0A0F3PD52_RICRH|nr:hypothetical protein RMAECT_0006 [Rickettsia rhipicephali str. Ect]